MSSGRDRRDDESFADALDDAEEVRPLAGRDDRVRERPGRSQRQPSPGEARFVFPDPDQPLLGFSSGISDAQLRRLRRGQIEPETSIDLHGLRADEARRECLAEIQRAANAGLRCLRVVHGRGRGSRGTPVLRESLPGWLADPRLEGVVLAFAPAPPEDGGSGASYVLLRRRRRPS